MSPFRRLLAYFRPYRGRALAALAAMAIVSLSTVLMLFLLTKIIDDVLGSGAAAAIPGLGRGVPARAGPFVRWLDSAYAAVRRAAEAAGVPVRLAVPLLLLAALVSKNVFSYFSEFAFNGIGLSMVRDLRRDAYGKLLSQSASFYSRSTTGDLLARLLSDVELIQSAFGTSPRRLRPGPVTIVLLLFYVFSLNARSRCSCLLLTPILLLPIVKVTRRLGRATIRRASGSASWARSSPRRSGATASSRPTRWRTSRPTVSRRPTTILPSHPPDRAHPGAQLPDDGDHRRDRPLRDLRLRGRQIHSGGMKVGDLFPSSLCAP